MKLVISIDVEEEGLFSGEYRRQPPGVRNVAALGRLEFIPREFGFPLTLLVSYHAATDPEARRTLEHWQHRHQAEIGAHLHHWNTPPFGHPTQPEPLSSRELPASLLADKLHTLVSAINGNFAVPPRSFRMGRFDWWPELLGMLPAMGFGGDSSMVPLAHYPGRVEQFLTPTEPFRLLVGQPSSSLVEVPLTLVPVSRRLARLTYRLSRRLPAPWGERLRARFRLVGAAGIHPAWFPLASMRLAVLLHRRRGGQVLTMFLHSSELQPGATPNFPTEAAVRRLTGKLRAFLAWLVATGPVTGVTLAELARSPALAPYIFTGRSEPHLRPLVASISP